MWHWWSRNESRPLPELMVSPRREASYYFGVSVGGEKTMSDIVKRICCATLVVIASAAARQASANDIIADEWTSVKIPPAPQLKTVTIDPKTTALLVLDMMKGSCGVRPRCGASVPTVKTLIDAARAHGMMVAHI